MTMLNTIGGQADEQVVAPQLSQGVNFADYVTMLQTLGHIDAQTASSFAAQLQAVQHDIPEDQSIVPDLALANGLDPKAMQRAVMAIMARDASRHLAPIAVAPDGSLNSSAISGAATIAQQSLNGQPPETYANLANHAPIAPTAVTPQIAPRPELTIAALQQQMDTARSELQKL